MKSELNIRADEMQNLYGKVDDNF